MGLHYPFFKAYDVRGRVPDELNEDLAWRIGRAYAMAMEPRNAIVGHDMRLSSPTLAKALIKGLTEGGCDVTDIGLCGTEEVYFHTFNRNMGGGIMVTASHNPPDYNGFKFVGRGAAPISADEGLGEIEELVHGFDFGQVTYEGRARRAKPRGEYVDYLLQQIECKGLRPLRVVVNAGNGCAGLVIDALEPHLPFEFIKLNHEPDGNLPNGVPNPLLPENRETTSQAVVEHQADMGIAWDGDFDRCFFFDEKGRFIEGYYIVGLLAASLISHHPGETVVYDPRLVWNTETIVKGFQGHAIMSRSGHSFIKAKMREVNAIYGGEMSAHHYFRNFAYCDNGTLPWLLIAKLVGQGDRTLSAMLDTAIARFPASGEINREVANADRAMQEVAAHYAAEAVHIEHLDGLSMSFDTWRFNLRKSNTEPLLRLNVESRDDAQLMSDRTADILELIDSLG